MKEGSEIKSTLARRPNDQGATVAASPASSPSAAISKLGKPDVLAGVTVIAQRLVAGEMKAAGSRDTAGRAAFRVCEKLRQPLSSLIGVAGFRSLFFRSLTLAKEEVPWLGGLEVGPDGALGFSAEMQAQLEGKEAERGGIALIAQLLGLLMTFIGEALTLRLVHNVWPKAAILESGSKGNSHE